MGMYSELPHVSTRAGTRYKYQFWIGNAEKATKKQLDRSTP